MAWTGLAATARKRSRLEARSSNLRSERETGLGDFAATPAGAAIVGNDATGRRERA